MSHEKKKLRVYICFLNTREEVISRVIHMCLSKIYSYFISINTIYFFIDVNTSE